VTHDDGEHAAAVLQQRGGGDQRADLHDQHAAHGRHALHRRLRRHLAAARHPARQQPALLGREAQHGGGRVVHKAHDGQTGSGGTALQHGARILTERLGHRHAHARHGEATKRVLGCGAQLACLRFYSAIRCRCAQQALDVRNRAAITSSIE
jgi:hypothetical protein